MSYQVDVRAVGNESKSGDAIALRYGDFVNNPSNQRVVVIDGGFKDDGKTVVDEIIKDYYGTTTVDLVISTHPDNDHISGLFEVIENLTVGQLWMHQPWLHASEIQSFLDTGYSSARTFSEALKKSLSSARDLATLAKRKGITIIEPFAGVTFDNTFAVLGPSEDYYNELVAQFGESATAPSLTSLLKSLQSGVVTAAQKAKRCISETWDSENLVEPEDNATSPRNNSSVISLAKFDDTFFLFTGDAGVPALTAAVSFAGQSNIDLSSTVKYFQVPHHGSKRNVRPSILTDLLGEPVEDENTKTGKTAFISAAKEGEPNHPSKRVTNALIRRGARVIATQGTPHCYWSTDANRAGWGKIGEIPFDTSYQEE